MSSTSTSVTGTKRLRDEDLTLIGNCSGCNGLRCILCDPSDEPVAKRVKSSVRCVEVIDDWCDHSFDDVDYRAELGLVNVCERCGHEEQIDVAMFHRLVGEDVMRAVAKKDERLIRIIELERWMALELVKKEETIRNLEKKNRVLQEFADSVKKSQVALVNCFNL